MNSPFSFFRKIEDLFKLANDVFVDYLASQTGQEVDLTDVAKDSLVVAKDFNIALPAWVDVNAFLVFIQGGLNALKTYKATLPS